MKKFRLIILFLFINIYGCAEYKSAKIVEKQYYSSSGFVLIYDDDLYLSKVINKKIINDNIEVMHSSLKKNTPVKIINPENSKFIKTKINKKADFPKIFKMVISSKVASILELDLNNPLVEIIEIKKNKTFVAKEGSIFEEEKIVSDKAPVEEIKMSDLTLNKSKEEKKQIKKNNYILVISDFYYLDSANTLKDELAKKIDISNIYIKKINNTKYRLFVGPFKNFNALKTTYISLNNLGFESLNIYNE